MTCIYLGTGNLYNKPEMTLVNIVQMKRTENALTHGKNPQTRRSGNGGPL